MVDGAADLVATGAAEQLAKAVALAAAIPQLPAHKQTMDADADAFEALRSALYATKKDEAALSNFAEEDMWRVFELLLRRSALKKPVIGRCKECLGILLVSSDWLRAAQSGAEMLENLKELSSDVPTLIERLTEVLPPGGVRKRPTSTSVSLNQEIAETKVDVESKLLSGRTVMAGFGFRFPQDHVSEKLDRATDGFQRVFAAVTKMGRSADKAGRGCKALAVLDTFHEKDFENFMTFFLTMYNSGVRNSFRLRIRFVVDKLNELCPDFHKVSDRREWGELSTNGAVAPVRNVGSGDAAAGGAAEDMASQQSVIVWVDFKKEAFESSSLAKVPDVRIEAFGDDDSVKPLLRRYMQECCSDMCVRVDVVILNKKHLDTIPQILAECKARSRRPPRFVIICQKTSDVKLAPYGVEDGAVVTRWEEATRIALEEVARRQTKAA